MKNDAQPKLYLISKSPRRSEILKHLQIKFDALGSTYEEDPKDVNKLRPSDQPVRLAYLKASNPEKKIENALLIGADTIVLCDGKILGKPHSRDEAEAMLRTLSSRSHQVITGIVLLDQANNKTYSHTEITDVYFKTLSEKELQRYLDTDEPYDKAGAYGIQDLAALFVERLDGCYYNVVGFPVAAFGKLMKVAGYDLGDYMEVYNK
ncbi:MAG: septum formation protein Maf [Candidatus Riflebacteria bacterium]|nr:septum formation protein Maf [Candidatus Riflebacteria bacterium]